MKRKTAKILAVVLILIVTMSVLSACKKNRIPDGRYEPVDPSMTVAMQAIVINGNNFTVVHGSGIGFTVKYTYHDGTITFTDGTGGISLPCTYKDGLLVYGGSEFTITK